MVEGGDHLRRSDIRRTQDRFPRGVQPRQEPDSPFQEGTGQNDVGQQETGQGIPLLRHGGRLDGGQRGTGAEKDHPDIHRRHIRRGSGCRSVRNLSAPGRGYALYIQHHQEGAEG